MTNWAATHGRDGVALSRAAPVFVGRDLELAALRQAMATPPAVVLIEGEAGIGKSRLVGEFLDAEADRQAVLVARCPPFRQPHTLSAVVDAVRLAVTDLCGLRLGGLAGALRPLFPEWAGELPPTPEPAEDATAARHRVFRALAELLDQLGVRLLVLEDAHWADEATLEFLLFLAAAPRPVSLLVTSRPEDVPEQSLLPRLSRFAGHGQRLTLGALDTAATARLVSSMLDGVPVSEEFAAFLYERTGGVPLSVEESVRLMVDRGDIFYRGGELVRRPLADIAVPPTLRDAVLERVRRLGRDAVAVLWAAATFSDPADQGTLRALAGLPAARVRHGLTEALGCGLLVEDDRSAGVNVMFRHVLVSRAVYEAIPGPQRRILHLRAGHLLEQATPAPVARLAAHFRAAGDIDQWCRYAEQAADIALTPGDEATASALLHDLVVHADLPARTVARLTGKIAFTAPPGDARFAELESALRSVLDRGGLPPGEAAEVRAQLGRVLGIMENFGAAYAELERAIPDLPPGSVAAGRAMLLLGWPLGAIRPVPVHLHWLRQAAAVAERSTDMLAHRAYGLLALGEDEGWTEAARLPRDAATAPERLTLAVGTMNLAEAARIWGRYADAEQRLAKALELAERDQHVRCRSIVLVQRARLDWVTGRWDGLAQRASDLADDEGLAPVSRLEAMLVSGLLRAATGARDLAEECLQRVYAGMRRHVGLESLEPAAALARLHLIGGDVQEALRLTDEPLDIVAGKGFWLHGTEVLPVRTAALTAAGRTEEAAQLVAAFARALGGRDAPAARAALATCQALITEAQGDHAAAAAAFSRVSATWAALPRPYVALLTREHEARCLLAAGSADAALAVLTAAWQGLATLGARADAERLAQELRRHGVAATRPWRGGRRGYGDQLSPRELEVVQLVAAGHATRAIAQRLSRSPDTIYSQLRSAMRKLGVPSRTALAVRAVELGITPER